MTWTSWLKYDHEIKKVIVYFNVKRIYVNIIEHFFQNFNFNNIRFKYSVNNIRKNSLKKKLLDVNFMLTLI